VLNNGSTNFPSLGFDVWVIDQNHMKFIETDATGNVLSGDAFTQQTSFPAGQIVFTVAGQNIGDPFVAGGYATATASGVLSAGVEDYNDAVTSSPTTFTASATNNGAGRYQLSTVGFTNATTGSVEFAAYPSSGGVLMLEDDSLGLAVGAAFAQGASPALNNSGGYALNLTGLNSLSATPFGEVDNIAQFDPGSPDTDFNGPVNMSGALDENDIGGPVPTSTLSGIYVPDTTADGRGSISATNTNTLLGGFALQYYVVDSSTVLFIDVDSEALDGAGVAQVGVGVFETQSSSSSSAHAAAAHKAMFVTRPLIHAHTKAKRK